MDCTYDKIDSLSMVKEKENEGLKQELFDMKKSYERTLLMKKDMELEVGRLEGKLKSVETQFEEEKREIIKTWVTRFNQAEAVLNEEREQGSALYEELQKKCDELELKATQAQAEAPLDQTTSKYQVEIGELTKKLLFRKECISELNINRNEMTEKNNELEKDLEEIQETLKSKSESLIATLHALEEMKDEKALLSAELAILKAGPMENKERGNSLFGEIEDKRAGLESKLHTLNNKYMELKRLHTFKDIELNKLKRENIKTKFYFEGNEENFKAKENPLVQLQKQTIEELIEKNNKLQSQILESPQFITRGTRDLEWVHIIVEKARSEVRDLRKELEQKNLVSLFHEQEKFALASKVLHLRKQLMASAAFNEDLKLKLASKENSSMENSLTVNGDPEGKEPRKKITFASDVKENDGVPLIKQTKNPL